MAMSAANAPDDNRDAAPAAISNLTLRIGFVLLSGEADEASHQKLTSGRCHQILKRHLTLIFKVDNLRRFFRAHGFSAERRRSRHNGKRCVDENLLSSWPGLSRHDESDQRAALGIFGRNTASRPMAGRN